MAQESSRISQKAVRLTAFLNRIVRAVAKHWLSIVNFVMAMQASLPLVPPILMATGHTSAARLIYTLFKPLCHQLPERSFFLFGPQLSYTLDELEHAIGPDVPLRYIGDASLGYKVAVCQRDIATFVAILLAGLAFIPLRRRLNPLPFKAFLLFCVPMAIDGFGQLFGLWESTWSSRVFSGALFGVACVWLAYPYVEAGMRDVLRVTSSERDVENGKEQRWPRS
jgi:uncharacterized membrane protein